MDAIAAAARWFVWCPAFLSYKHLRVAPLQQALTTVCGEGFLPGKIVFIFRGTSSFSLPSFHPTRILAPRTVARIFFIPGWFRLWRVTHA
jgi:hypothetical protein